MSDARHPIGQTILELKEIFADAAAKSPLFRPMTTRALVGLETAELQYKADLVATSIETTRRAILEVLGEQNKIRAASRGDEHIQALFDEVAEKAITKGIDILAYGIDVFTDQRSEMSRILEMRSRTAAGPRIKN